MNKQTLSTNDFQVIRAQRLLHASYKHTGESFTHGTKPTFLSGNAPYNSPDRQPPPPAHRR